MLRVCAGTDVAGKERTAAARAWYGCYGSSWLSSRWSSAYRQHCRINWFTEIPVSLCSSTSSRSIHSVKRTVLGMLVALNFRSRSGCNINFTTLSAIYYTAPLRQKNTGKTDSKNDTIVKGAWNSLHQKYLQRTSLEVDLTFWFQAAIR